MIGCHARGGESQLHIGGRQVEQGQQLGGLKARTERQCLNHEGSRNTGNGSVLAAKAADTEGAGTVEPRWRRAGRSSPSPRSSPRRRRGAASSAAVSRAKSPPGRTGRQWRRQHAAAAAAADRGSHDAGAVAQRLEVGLADREGRAGRHRRPRARQTLTPAVPSPRATSARTWQRPW